VNNAPVIGIAGTAKNTGKTTTLNCLLDAASQRQISAAVTGIGYDGEEIDTITRLPKPRILLRAGTIAATSELCVTGATNDVEILARTGIRTPLGEVLIVRMLSDGLLVIAGPNTRNELAAVTGMMRQFAVQLIVVDGSLNRVSPMSVVDTVIITTGGSRSEEIGIIAAELNAIVSLLTTPEMTVSDTVDRTTITVPFLLEAEDVHTMLYRTFGTEETIDVTGSVSLPALEYLLQQLERRRYPFRLLIFNDPFMLLMNDDRVRTDSVVRRIRSSGYAVGFRHTPYLACCTANPFIPKFEGTTYIPAHLDASLMMETLRSISSIPVFNTSETPHEVILESCLYRR
jgi:hypothetical protein